MLLRALTRRGRPLWPRAPHGILAVAALAPGSPGLGRVKRRATTEAERDREHTPVPSRALVVQTAVPTLALTYYGGERIRRAALTPVGPRPLWERGIGTGGTVLGRFGGAALCEGDAMLVAVRLQTGEEKWRLTGHGPLTCASSLPDGDLLLEFESGEWLRVRPVSGRRCDSGDRKRDARHLGALRADARPLAASPTEAVDGCAVERDGEALVLAAPGHHPLRIEPDGSVVVAGTRLGRL